MSARPMPEAKVKQLLTLEWMFCIRCWAAGKRVQVIKPSRDFPMGTPRYKQARRRRAAAHYRQAHPEVSF